MKKKIIKVGTKPTVRVEEIESEEVKFEKDLEHQKGSNPETIPGENGTKEITTTYKLDTNTGEVSELETTEKILTQPTPTVVKVPAKPKVETQVLPTTIIRYEKDITKEKGSPIQMIDGVDGLKTTTTNYNVDPITGKITEDIKIDINNPTDTIVKVPAKDSIKEETIPFTTTYKEDGNLSVGEEVEVTPGKNGKVITTITYNVDEKSGKITESSSTQIQEPQTRVIKKGTKVHPEVETPATETPEESKPDNSTTETPTQPGTDNPATNTPEENKPGNSATETPTHPEKSKENIFTAELADGVIISVTYNSLGTDVNKLVAKDVDNKEANRIKSLVRKLYPELSVVRTLELHFANKNNKEIAVPGNRTVTLALDAKGNQLKVYHVDGDDLKEIENPSYENGMLTFETPHFSTFVIASNNILKVSKDHVHQAPQIILPSRSIESTIQSSVDKITQLSVQKSEETKKSNKKDKSLPNTGLNTSNDTVLSLILITLFGLVTRKKLSNK